MNKYKLISNSLALLVLGFLFVSNVDLSQQQNLNNALGSVEGNVDPVKAREVKTIRKMKPDNSEYTLGELVENFMDSPTYELYNPAQDGNTYLTIKGNVQYGEQTVTATLKYRKINKKEYKYHVLSLNDVPQEPAVAEDLFEKMEDSCDVKFGKKKSEQQVAKANVQQTDQTNTQRVAKANAQQVAQTNTQQAAQTNTQQAPKANTQQASPQESSSYEQQGDPPSEDYLLPYSDTDYLTDEDLQMIYETGDRDLVRLIINEMYARHGFVFKKAKNRDYFMSQSWYHPVEGLTDEYIKTQLFNEYEKANLKALLEVEEMLK
ncbi:YARHG domain-containing protein [Filifactor villosus]|uniref:YARHG domain-containing protein n=1 Tax=Filifactor villosus TaxID=29374 RepID=A0ABV9QIN5_9FIRM